MKRGFNDETSGEDVYWVMLRCVVSVSVLIVKEGISAFPPYVRKGEVSVRDSGNE